MLYSYNLPAPGKSRPIKKHHFNIISKCPRNLHFNNEIPREQPTMQQLILIFYFQHYLFYKVYTKFAEHRSSPGPQPLECTFLPAPVLQGEVNGGQESRATSPGPDQQKAWGPRPHEHGPHGASQQSTSDVSGRELPGCTQASGFFGTPSKEYWSLVPLAGKRACPRKEHEGNFKAVFIFPSSGQEWEIKPTLQDEQQEQGALCIICYRWKAPWCYLLCSCFSYASLPWGAWAHILYCQQERSFCLCKTLFFFLV